MPIIVILSYILPIRLLSTSMPAFPHFHFHPPTHPPPTTSSWFRSHSHCTALHWTTALQLEYTAAALSKYQIKPENNDSLPFHQDPESVYVSFTRSLTLAGTTSRFLLTTWKYRKYRILENITDSPSSTSNHSIYLDLVIGKSWPPPLTPKYPEYLQLPWTHHTPA